MVAKKADQMIHNCKLSKRPRSRERERERERGREGERERKRNIKHELQGNETKA